MNIEIGDIVTVVGDEDSLFVVLSIEDFSDEEVADFDFELARIYPQSVNSRFSSEGVDDVILYLKRGTSLYDIKMKSLSEKRKDKGWCEAEYIILIEKALASKLEEPEESDEIDYSNLETTDECLDAIIYLNSLYYNFGDKDYLNKRAVVIKRLKELSK